MNVSTWSIRQPTPVLLLFIILTFAGLVGFKSLRIQNFPDVDLPAVTVTASLPGVSPSQLETEVTRKIEDAVSSIDNIKHISSTVTDGSSVTTIEFNMGKDVQVAVNDVRDKVSSIHSQLPADLPDPVISRISVTGNAVLTYAISSPSMDATDLSWFVDNIVNKSLQAVPGVAKVTRQGGVDREIRVSLDPTRLLALNVTAATISAQLRSMQQLASGGRTSIDGMEQSISTVGTVQSAQDLANLSIPLGDGRHIHLGDVATVRDTAAEPSQMALLDGKPVTSFQVFRSTGTSEVSVAKSVRAAVKQLAAAHPDIKITEVNNSVRQVQESYDASMHALMEGALLAVIIVWLFLRDWRATFVSAVALPLSILPTFAAMQLFDFTLNTLTLLALTLVIGILIDDAIVEVENIDRHLQGGKTPMQAALDAVQEIGLAVIATSLTLVAVFLPTAFMGGVPGKFFRQFGLTASIAVLASLLVARLLTPMMAAYLLKPHGGEKREDGRLMRWYLAAVGWCLGHPGKVTLAAGLFFVASMALVPLMPSGFFPAQDQGQVMVNVETAPGSTIHDVEAVTQAARQMAAGMKNISSIYVAIGAGTSGGMGAVTSGGEVRKATMTIMLVARNRRHESQQQIEAVLRNRFAAIPGARFTFGSGGMGEKLSLVLGGDDPQALQTAATAVSRDLRTLPGLGNITSSASLSRPEVVVRPDFTRASQLGVTTQAISQAVRVATSGDFDVNLAKLNLPDRQVPIRVELDPAARQHLDTIAQLRVPAASGSVPLQSIADISMGSGPAEISRYDRSRAVTINAELQGQALGDVTRKVDQLPSIKHLPTSVHRIASGDAESMQELFSGFALAMVAGIFCVYAVLVLLFHDFLQPGTILAALPLSVGGALGFLLLFGYSLSLPALIGLLMLMGIVTKNSILLVEYAIVARREHGLSRTEALLDACHKRARPIIMTTLAMIAGMVPMALGLEGDGAFRGPMAVAVIGGLITSTALSLLVVPVVFELLDELKQKVRRQMGKIFGPSNAAQEERV